MHGAGVWGNRTMLIPSAPPPPPPPPQSVLSSAAASIGQESAISPAAVAAIGCAPSFSIHNNRVLYCT